jgi:YbgC/YbaW family acyl-CoA thioester hydrolase
VNGPVDRASFRYFHRLRVRWPEVDAQRVVFNGQYLAYFDAVNSGYWRAVGLPYPEAFERDGGDTFVKKATLEYHASAGYDDFLDVGMKCARVGNSSMTFVAGYFRGDTLLVTAEVVYVFFEQASRRPTELPADTRTTLEAFEAGESVVRAAVGSWSDRAGDVRALRPEEEDDPRSIHVVLLDRRQVPVASGRVLDEAGRGVVGGVVVRPSMRGGGFGRQLVHALAEAARERGLRSLVVRPAPAEAPFFQRAGFHVDPADRSLKWNW